MKEIDKFEVIALGIILDSKTKKILIGKREADPFVKNLDWTFPGGRVNNGESVDEALKKGIKEKTGLEVENLGAIFAQAPPEKQDRMLIIFLTEIFGGEEKVGGKMTELKWISPKDIEEYIKVFIHPKLKEFIIDLV
jgi:8-oxo-dGTP diphosphatase